MNNPLKYHYRIKILNNSGEFGDPFGILEVDALPQSQVYTTVLTSGRQMKKNIAGFRGSINDSMMLSLEFSNPTRKITQVQWFEDSTLLKTTSFDSLGGSDSLVRSWGVVGDKNVWVRVTDESGYVWNESLIVSILADAPVISFVDSTLNLNVLDTLSALVSDEFGEIVSYEWDLGNDGVVDGTDSLFVTTLDSLVDSLPCKLTVISRGKTQYF